MASRENVQLRLLQQRCSALRRQFVKLSAQRDLLNSQLAVLDGLCASFKLMQVEKELQSMIDDEALHEGYQEELHQLRSELLQLIPATSTSMTSTAGAEVVAQVPVTLEEDTEVRRAAPRTSQMHLLNQLASLAPLQDVSTIQVAGLLRDAVVNGSLQLHVRQLGHVPAEAVDDSLSTMWHKWVSAALQCSLLRCIGLVFSAAPTTDGLVCSCAAGLFSTGQEFALLRTVVAVRSDTQVQTGVSTVICRHWSL
jgi:hypothetical protein